MKRVPGRGHVGGLEGDGRFIKITTISKVKFIYPSILM